MNRPSGVKKAPLQQAEGAAQTVTQLFRGTITTEGGGRIFLSSPPAPGERLAFCRPRVPPPVLNGVPLVVLLQQLGRLPPRQPPRASPVLC